MWVYNVIQKCAINSRIFLLPSAWQRTSNLPRSAHSNPFQILFLSTQRPTHLTLLAQSSVKRQLMKKDLHLSKCVQSDVASNLAKDVLLFKYDNVKLHKIITLFGIVNFTMMMMISTNIYTVISQSMGVEGESPSEFDSETNDITSVSSPSPRPIYTETNDISTSTDSSVSEKSKGPISSSYVLTALCGVTFVLGYVVLAGTWIYCNHVVRYIVLHKCGKKATVVTHGIFAMNRYRTWDLNQLSCRGNRTISSAVLLNAKGKFFSYILDIKGTYTNPKLFDATVGVHRNLKK